MTASALNGLARSVARYLQIGALLPTIAAETHEGLGQLLDYYYLAVFTLFVPAPVVRSSLNTVRCVHITQ